MQTDAQRNLLELLGNEKQKGEARKQQAGKIKMQSKQLVISSYMFTLQRT